MFGIGRSHPTNYCKNKILFPKPYYKKLLEVRKIKRNVFSIKKIDDSALDLMVPICHALAKAAENSALLTILHCFKGFGTLFASGHNLLCEIEQS